MCQINHTLWCVVLRVEIPFSYPAPAPMSTVEINFLKLQLNQRQSLWYREWYREVFKECDIKSCVKKPWNQWFCCLSHCWWCSHEVQAKYQCGAIHLTQLLSHLLATRIKTWIGQLSPGVKNRQWFCWLWHCWWGKVQAKQQCGASL